MATPSKPASLSLASSLPHVRRTEQRVMTAPDGCSRLLVRANVCDFSGVCDFDPFGARMLLSRLLMASSRHFRCSAADRH
jgi:hypothetical protein